MYPVLIKNLKILSCKENKKTHLEVGGMGANNHQVLKLLKEILVIGAGIKFGWFWGWDVFYLYRGVF